MSPVLRLLRRGLTIGGVTTAAAFLLPGAAQAGLVPPSDCVPANLTQPFQGDQNYYQQVLGRTSMSAGSSVLAAPACVNLTHPVIRFVVSGDPTATVSVDAAFSTGAAAVYIPVGSVPADIAGGVSPQMPINVVNMAALGGGNALVSLRFSVEGGSAVIDSAWVDPWRWW